MRHQRSPEGREDHRDRQRAYRARRALLAARVTEQGTEKLTAAGTVLVPVDAPENVSEPGIAG